MPLVDLGSFVRALRPDADAIPALQQPTDPDPLPPERPAESDGHWPVAFNRAPPSAVQTLAMAVAVAEFKAVAVVAEPLLESAEPGRLGAGRSATKTGEYAGAGTDALFDLRFLGSFSFRNFGCCSVPAL